MTALFVRLQIMASKSFHISCHFKQAASRYILDSMNYFEFLKLKIYMIYFQKHSSELIFAQQYINCFKLQIFGPLALNMSFLQDCFGG